MSDFLCSQNELIRGHFTHFKVEWVVSSLVYLAILAQLVHQQAQPLAPFLLNSLIGAAIFSPFHLFTLSPLEGRSHFFTFSPFHLYKPLQGILSPSNINFQSLLA